MSFNIEWGEIIIAGFAAAICTFFCIKFLDYIKQLKNPDYHNNAEEHEDIKNILQKCYIMFPIDNLLYHGITFTRGTRVRITTVQHKIIEGIFIGTNKQEILCIQTNRHIVAHGMDGITEIIKIDEA